MDNALTELAAESLEEYWFDWAQILAAHKMGKLGQKKKMRDLMYNVSEQLRPIKMTQEVKK